MKRIGVLARFFLLSVSLSAISAAAETPVERYGQLAVDGNRLISTKTGQPVQLRGMSLFWSMAGEGCGFYNADVVNTLADDWKANVVRAAMGVDENWGSGSLGYRVGNKACGTTNDALVKTVVEAAIAKGIYAIIDYHSHSAYKYPDKALEFFREMAGFYKDKPNVIYEIFNEPTQGEGTPRPSSATFWANDVKPYSQTIVNAIREIDPNNVIIIGTPTWCQDVDVAAKDSVVGKNLVYAVHFYSASHKDTFRTKARNAMNTSNKAIFVSEFGVCHSSAGPPLDTAEATKWLNFLDSNKVSWVNWSISDKDKQNDTTPEVSSAIVKNGGRNGGWTTEKLTVSGNYIREKLIAAYENEQSVTSVQTADRVIPGNKHTAESAIAPAGARSNKFSAGPVPTSLTSGGVKFFWQGKSVTGGTLRIYDALGNSVNNISINDASSGNSSKRTIGAWDLTDANGRRVTAGSYLVKGKLLKQDGNAATVSSIIVISN